MTGRSAGAFVRDAVMAQGRVVGDLLMVDGFLNHRVDPVVMRAVGAEFANRYSTSTPDLILTAEASGIPPAVAYSVTSGVPMVYAKKFPGPGHRDAHFRIVTSPTKGYEYRVEVGKHVLGPGLRVVVIDDFLARGRTAEALAEIVEEAGSTVVGCGFVVEKTFMDGRHRLERHGWAVDALVRVESLDGGVVTLAEDDIA